MNAPNFTLFTTQQVIGMLKATRSTDIDVLAATRQDLLGQASQLKMFGIFPMVVGIAMTVTIIGAVVGIPVLVFGVWARGRGKKNIDTVNRAFAEYTQSINSAVAVPA